MLHVVSHVRGIVAPMFLPCKRRIALGCSTPAYGLLMDHMNRKRSLAASITSRIFALHVAWAQCPCRHCSSGLRTLRFSSGLQAPAPRTTFFMLVPVASFATAGYAESQAPACVWGIARMHYEKLTFMSSRSPSARSSRLFSASKCAFSGVVYRGVYDDGARAE